MRIARLLLTLPVLLISLAVGYLVYGAQAEISAAAQTAPAQDYAQTYDSIVAAVQTGVAEAVFTDAPFTEAADYTLVSVQVTMRNPGALPMEWISCEVVPIGDDVAVYEIADAPVDLASKAEAAFFVRLIRGNSGAQAGGELRVSYYVAGQKIEKTIAY